VVKIKGKEKKAQWLLEGICISIEDGIYKESTIASSAE
jgi:hypothetical protein